MVHKIVTFLLNKKLIKKNTYRFSIFINVVVNLNAIGLILLAWMGVYLQEKQLEVVEEKVRVQQSLLQIRSFIDAGP